MATKKSGISNKLLGRRCWINYRVRPDKVEAHIARLKEFGEKPQEGFNQEGEIVTVDKNKDGDLYFGVTDNGRVYEVSASSVILAVDGRIPGL